MTNIGILKETVRGERRTALSPSVLKKYQTLPVTLLMERGAGSKSFFADADYEGVEICTAKRIFQQADILLKVQPPKERECKALREHSVLIGMLQPFQSDASTLALRDQGVTSFSMELIPRIARAQSMDVLSSQASLAGYKAALMAADRVARFFPMLTTAAGTIRPLRVLVLGTGVAGLQAIATARRLGAVVEAYDIRKAAKEQVESLGARFLATAVDAEDERGYARPLTEDEQKQEIDLLAEYIAASQVVITTAAIPGRPAPRLISEDMVRGMQPGAVIVDLAAESGGNCELTQPGKTVTQHQVDILGPLNVPSMVATHASDMYSQNLFNFVSLLIDEQGRFAPNWDDPVVAECCLTHAGEIRNQRVLAHLQEAGS